MESVALRIADVKLLTPTKCEDQRGSFSETYSKRSFRSSGIEVEFVQDNHSFSAKKGTVRGIHFQAPPFAQDKLVRVVRGSILDVAVDLRRGSPTYGEYDSTRIDATAWNQLFIPIGFGHAFCTLEPDTEVFYKCSGYYQPDHEMGIVWNDPDIGIKWPFEDGYLSKKDRNLPRLREVASPFVFQAEP